MVIKGSQMRGENDGELVSAMIGFRNGRVFKDDKCAITFLGRVLNQFLGKADCGASCLLGGTLAGHSLRNWPTTDMKYLGDPTNPV